MFAGRYLWWVLMCVAGFLFFAVYFDYVTWMLVQLSGCAKSAGSCGRIGTAMQGNLKPLGFWAVGAVLFGCTLWRILYLRMNPGWGVAAGIWFLVSAPFLMLFDRLWSGQLTYAVIAEVPVSCLFLAAFVAYLALPLEEIADPAPDEEGEDGQSRRVLQWLQRISAVAAVHAVLLSLALEPRFPRLAADWTGVTMLRDLLEFLQPGAFYVLTLGTGSLAPAYAMFFTFVAGLGATFFLRLRPVSLAA